MIGWELLIFQLPLTSMTSTTVETHAGSPTRLDLDGGSDQ